MIRLRKNSGVTLIELLVVLGLLGVVTAMAAGLFSNSMGYYKNDDAQWQIQQDARFAIKEITKDVRSADSISITTPTEDGVTKYVLNLDNGGIPIIIKWEYDANGDKVLYRIVNGTKSKIIGFMEDIVFEYPQNVLTINLTTKKADKTFTLSTKLSRRVTE
jgi:prepilin-type N-terminal cleavage/methylation domain-containing protein